MKINLAKSAGFCFGVRRAITITLKTTAQHKDVRMLGDIVHNEDVIAMMEKNGVKKIRTLRKNRGQTLVIRAHGSSASVFRRARALGYCIVDATCPMVKEIHKMARQMESEGRRIIIIGDKKHDEVRGIKGQLKTKAFIVPSAGAALRLPFRRIKKAGVVIQSTQDEENARGILRTISSRVPDLKFFNTICAPTRVKQTEIKAIPLKNDAVIIIGSRASANTRRLFEIAKKLNPRAYWVQRAGDIRPRWLKGISSIGITTGASTPDATTQEVIARIRTLCA
ncbi:MAG: 4-hydroxy-3-methylbut-2-enyl diphosphate reductase [Candidatus Omnitrophica bacterium]|nr:4-hydroxy-3-methylbut-2-enyl diphosphate reductase [Candidatus Omnitrophota bacterium]MDD5573636.1 4-hydroxy-3-methylbut-2-enyl diphosphate reductase [Candidatus Omnitrophota bacterium]